MWQQTCDLFLKDARCILLQYVHKPPKVAKMVKNSSAHTHTEWQDATPVANESVASIQVGLGHVGLGIVVALVLSVLSSLLLMFLLGSSVVSTVTTGGGLEGDWPCWIGHRLQAKVKWFAIKSGKLNVYGRRRKRQQGDFNCFWNGMQSPIVVFFTAKIHNVEYTCSLVWSQSHYRQDSAEANYI